MRFPTHKSAGGSLSLSWGLWVSGLLWAWGVWARSLASLPLRSLSLASYIVALSVLDRNTTQCSLSRWPALPYALSAVLVLSTSCRLCTGEALGALPAEPDSLETHSRTFAPVAQE